jgi:1-phosphatidylinositol-3-phosphate 5-kinase
MEDPQTRSPLLGTFNGPLSRSRSYTKLVDDVTSLTSFNPFSEEDENDQSSYTLVTSLFSRMKNTLTAPLSSAVAGTSVTSNGNASGGSEQRRPSYSGGQNSQTSNSSRISAAERPTSLSAIPSNLAPPLVSLIPVVSEAPSYNLEYDRLPSRGMYYSQSYDGQDGRLIGTAIPGFPIHDDARSIRTSTSLQRSESVSKVIRRIRGEGEIH